MPTVRESAKSTHWPGASSEAAVRNIEKNQTRKNGLSNSRNIWLAGMPAAARSVGGNFKVKLITPNIAAGNSVQANLIFHDAP